jgi:molybdopterin-binding protein
MFPQHIFFDIATRSQVELLDLCNGIALHSNPHPRRHNMKVSARNLIPGVVKKVNIGMVNAEVVIEAAPDVEIVSVITKESVERMGIKVGSKVKAMVKATSVMVVTD